MANDKTINTRPSSGEAECCMQCDYPLTGLAPEGNCPECGLAISATRNQLHRIYSRSLFVILARLIAIFLVTRISVIDNDFMLAIFEIAMSQNSYSKIEMLYYGLPFALTIIPAVLLWILAPKIATIAIPVNAPLLINSGGSKTLILIAVCLMSIWLIVNGVDSQVEMLLRAYGKDFRHDTDIYADSYDSPALSYIVESVKFYSGFVLFLVFRRFWKKLT